MNARRHGGVEVLTIHVEVFGRSFILAPGRGAMVALSTSPPETQEQTTLTLHLPTLPC